MLSSRVRCEKFLNRLGIWKLVGFIERNVTKYSTDYSFSRVDIGCEFPIFHILYILWIVSDKLGMGDEC